LFNPRIAAAARTAVAGVCIGLAAVSVASGCRPATSAMRAAAPSPTAGGTHLNASLTPVATTSPTTSGVYGDPAAAAKFWQVQSLEDNCGLMSVADVVGELTGHAPTEEQMVTLAEKTPSGSNPGPIYAPRNDPSHAGDNGGIEMADEVVLLDHYGIKSKMTYAKHPEETGLPALEGYLSTDRKIIAWVNSAIIWNTSDQRTKADHFLVVTGVDADKEVVHLNDPGADHPDEKIPISTFMTAWKTGEESIVVTAAPG
jgi:Peptidase_C39 like family